MCVLWFSWANIHFSTPCRNFSNFFLKTMISVIHVQMLVWVSMRKKFYKGKNYFEALLNNQYNWVQNNTAQFYLMLGRAKLCWNFSDGHRFSKRKWVSIMCNVEKLENIFWSIGRNYWSSCMVFKRQNKVLIECFYSYTQTCFISASIGN